MTQEARAFELWFFREISDEQRRSMIALILGQGIADESTNHGRQRVCLHRIMPALTAAHTEAAELKARVEAAHAAINALCRVLGPVGMTLAQQECIGEPLPREAVILSFMGSGASDNVTVGELEDAMALARQALGGVS